LYGRRPGRELGGWRGGWFGQFGAKDLEEWAKVETAEAVGAEALLLGRRSDEWFALRWASRSSEWADKLNGMPTYVVSATLEQPSWSSNSTVLRGEVVQEVSKLKHGRARGRRAPLRRDERGETHAPGEGVPAPA